MKKPVKRIESKTSGAAQGAPPALDTAAHTALFARAMKSFTAGDYRKARDLFDEAAQGPSLKVNESALMYSRMCQQRISRDKPDLKTPEDMYNYAVTLINARNYAEARPHLESAVRSAPLPHFCYALALVEGLTGALDAAVPHLKQALQMDPSIRALARNDPDFHPLLQYPALREVLAGESSQAG